MHGKKISLTRRNLMIAGLAGAAAPALTFAAPASERAGVVSGMSIRRGETLLISGRVVDAAGKPLAHTRV